MKKFAMIALIAFAPVAVMADQAAATKCRGKLNKEARLIYDQSLPLATPDANLRDVVTEQTRALAGAGTIPVETARPNAEAAGECLKLLRK
ncbi:MAG: hypothetical protein NTY59_13290 [Alphaproteobacteria bacterium]|nr:hypothetical protein [Alphaproteobacteria bacterium]